MHCRAETKVKRSRRRFQESGPTAHFGTTLRNFSRSQLNSSFMDCSSFQGIKCLFSSRQLTDPTMSLRWKRRLPNKQSGFHRLSRGRETLFQEATLLLGSLKGIFHFLLCREPDVSEDLTAPTRNSFLKRQSGTVFSLTTRPIGPSTSGQTGINTPSERCGE